MKGGKMNKKGMSLIAKIGLGIPLLLTGLLGVDSIIIGLTRSSLIGKIIPSIPIMFGAYVVMGIAGLITAGALLVKIIKE